MKVFLSEEAVRYVQRERAYLAQFSRRASIAFSEQVKRATRLIGDHPHVGTAVAPVEGIRRFVSAPYHPGGSDSGRFHHACAAGAS